MLHRLFVAPIMEGDTIIGVKNLIVTGRTIGGDKVSYAAVRNMMCCAVAGQGAGVAAALAVKTGRGFAELDLAEVQRELLHQGARIK